MSVFPSNPFTFFFNLVTFFFIIATSSRYLSLVWILPFVWKEMTLAVLLLLSIAMAVPERKEGIG
jgi:hypothetical protein